VGAIGYSIIRGHTDIHSRQAVATFKRAKFTERALLKLV
jgi:hypothetical protein